MHFALGLTEKRPLKDMYKTMKDIPRQFEGFETYVRFFLEVAQDVFNTIRSELGHDMVQFTTSGVEKVDEWMLDVRQLCDDQMSNKLKVTPQDSDRVFRLVSRGNEIFSQYGSRRDISVQLNQFRNTLEKIKAPFLSANLVDSGHRQPPLCMMVQGPSGIGKSYLLYPLIFSIIQRVIPEAERYNFMANKHAFVYGRQAEHKFWDGYRGQFAAVFDDFAQIRDMTGVSDNEFMDIIRCGQLFPNVLHMADLESKGCNYFISKLMVASTNLQNITHQHIQSIVEPEAVQRRFDIVIQPVPKVEFCKEGFAENDNWTRRLDFSKVPTDDTSLDIYDFHLKELSTSRVLRTFSFESLVDYCVEQFQQRTDGWQNYADMVDKVIFREFEKRNAIAQMAVQIPGFDPSTFDPSKDDDPYKLDAYIEWAKEQEEREIREKENTEVTVQEWYTLDKMCRKFGYSLLYVQEVFKGILRKAEGKSVQERLQQVFTVKSFREKLAQGFELPDRAKSALLSLKDQVVNLV